MSLRRKLSNVSKKQIAEKQQYKCAHCELFPLPSTYQVDHIVPHAIGGCDDQHNLQALCPNCHARKTQQEALRISQFKRMERFCTSDVRPCWCCLKKKSLTFFITCEPVCGECDDGGRIILSKEKKQEYHLDEQSHIKKYKNLQNVCNINTRVCFLCLQTFSAFFKHVCTFKMDHNSADWWDKYVYKE